MFSWSDFGSFIYQGLAAASGMTLVLLAVLVAVLLLGALALVLKRPVTFRVRSFGGIRLEFSTYDASSSKTKQRHTS